jgi:hypothetical protein
MSERSIIRAGFDAGLGSPEAQGGNVNINAQENVLLTDNSFISNIIDIDSVGESGDIIVLRAISLSRLGNNWVKSK